VDGENLMYRWGEGVPHNVDRSPSFHKVRAEYPGHDTRVSVVYKHAQRRTKNAQKPH
jgi:hypothetical protein